MTLMLPRIDAPATIRPLLNRDTRYVVTTATLAAYITAQVVREQEKHSVQDTVQWALAMFDVIPVSGGTPRKSTKDIGGEIDDLLEEAFGDRDLVVRGAFEIIQRSLASHYAQQVRVTGYLPGYRIAERGRVIELSGLACPNCHVNPTGFAVGDRTNTARCLNSEDCGWTNG